jgi:hypothetical protein
MISIVVNVVTKMVPIICGSVIPQLNPDTFLIILSSIIFPFLIYQQRDHGFMRYRQSASWEVIEDAVGPNPAHQSQRVDPD